MIISVQMRNDLISIVELVLTMMTVYIVDWRLLSSERCMHEKIEIYNLL